MRKYLFATLLLIFGLGIGAAYSFNKILAADAGIRSSSSEYPVI